MGQATYLHEPDTVKFATPVALVTGEVIQLADGRAGVYEGLAAAAINDQVSIRVKGKFTVEKTADLVILKGDKVFFDRSANTATPLQALAGGDFLLGSAVDDAAAAATTVDVELNEVPSYLIELFRDNWDTALVGAAALNMGPGYAKLLFDTTAEAQKVDLLSQKSCPLTVPFIVEGRFALIDDADTADKMDVNIGVANATHASDGDSITESVFIHVDGEVLNILAESDDGTTEVAATDTTVDHVLGTSFDFRIDARDLADIQIYINAVLVLPASVFKLNAATGPMKLLAHSEKSSDDTLGEIRVEHLALRTMDTHAV